MAYLDLRIKEIQLKIVYYGPGQAGKTTNLLYIHKHFNRRIKSDLVSINTCGDRTLFFDFMPFTLGKINGFNIKVQMYTVPGQPIYNATRKVVLKGVDGVVFVADITASMRSSNIASMQDLYENLRAHHKNIYTLPLVFQFNKIDLARNATPVLSPEVLNRDLNSMLKRPYFAASALEGMNVASTLKKIIVMTATSLKTNLASKTTNAC